MLKDRVRGFDGRIDSVEAKVSRWATDIPDKPSFRDNRAVDKRIEEILEHKFGQMHGRVQQTIEDLEEKLERMNSKTKNDIKTMEDTLAGTREKFTQVSTRNTETYDQIRELRNEMNRKMQVPNSAPIIHLVDLL